MTLKSSNFRKTWVVEMIVAADKVANYGWIKEVIPVTKGRIFNFKDI